MSRKSTMESIFCIRQLVKKYIEKIKVVYNFYRSSRKSIRQSAKRVVEMDLNEKGYAKGVCKYK